MNLHLIYVGLGGALGAMSRHLLGGWVLHHTAQGRFPAGTFAVNVLGASQRDLAAKFAIPSDDKFAGVDWQRGLGDAPLLANTVAAFQCRAVDRYYGGDHVIFLGAVEAYAYNHAEPLLFARGGFGHFTPGP